MLSTHSQKREQSFVFVSYLSVLLKERAKTQKQLAEKTGLLPARISRLVNQKVVHKIVAETAIKICFALSHWPRLKDKKRVAVGLDALFSMRREGRSNRKK